MDIDLATIIIVTIALALFILPITYYEIFVKRKTKKFTAYFHELASTNSIKLSQFDVWRDSYAIGIDNETKHLFYLKQKNGQDDYMLIDLSKVKRCRISIKDDRLKTPDGIQNVIVQVELHIEFHSTEKPNLTVSFFTKKDGYSVSEEVSLAEKWSRTINNKLKKL
jgi:hypothetical protein